MQLATISVVKRQAACLRLLRGNFDVDGVVSWMLKEYADEPVIERAKDKEKLCRNIVTIGGTGAQQELNLVAFRGALDDYAVDMRRKAEQVLQNEIQELKADLKREQAQNIQLDKEYREATQRSQDLQERLHDSEKQVLQLNPPEPATV